MCWGLIRAVPPACALPIAIGILAASGQLREVDRLRDTALIGELGLDGGLRAVPGTLALAAASFAAGVPSLIVSRGATSEAAAVSGLRVHGADSLGEAVRHLAGVQSLALAEPTELPDVRIPIHGPDLAEVSVAAWLIREDGERLAAPAASRGRLRDLPSG